MEKVIAVLMRPEPDDDWCARQRAQVADALLGLGVAGLSINVRDSTVRDSLMTLTTLYPPVAAVVSLWTQQCYGEQVAAALRLLAQECDELGAYLVTESVPLTFPSLVESGSRTPGLANIALAPKKAFRSVVAATGNNSSTMPAIPGASGVRARTTQFWV